MRRQIAASSWASAARRKASSKLRSRASRTSSLRFSANLAGFDIDSDLLGALGNWPSLPSAIIYTLLLHKSIKVATEKAARTPLSPSDAFSPAVHIIKCGRSILL